MTEPLDHSEYLHALQEIRQAREQAETLRDQLLAEYERQREDDQEPAETGENDGRRQRGLEAMRQAITAANCAIASIDQALREVQRAQED